MEGRRGSTSATDAVSRHWDTALIFLVMIAVLFVRFLHPALTLGYYQDDFFYYLKVAQSIAATGVSTFNGIALTNGYHPLWMAVLVALCWMLHGTALLVAIQAVSLAAAVATYLLFRRIFCLLMPDAAGRACAFALGVTALLLMRYGMEVTLTIPLAALLFLRLVEGGPPTEPLRAACLGVLSSLVILSRLDAGLLVALLCFVSLPEVFRARQPIRVVVAFACGVLPLLMVYFALNLHFFHLLTPVSGLSKQMKTTWVPSSETWVALAPTDRMKRLIVAPQLVVLAAGLVGLFTIRRPRAYTLRLFAAMMLFPLFHWCLLSELSDWPMWAWYYYSLTLGCAGAFAVLSEGKAIRQVAYGAGAFSVLLLVYSAAYVWQGPNSIAVLQSSSGLARFMDAHPGVWLVGDQAGTTGYLSKQPIVQMEGLVMDRAFLETMRKSTPLRDVVQQYHGDYYAVFAEPDSDGCTNVSEPTNAGPTSPHMRGRICSPPIATFDRGDARIHVFPARAVQ